MILAFLVYTWLIKSSSTKGSCVLWNLFFFFFFLFSVNNVPSMTTVTQTKQRASYVFSWVTKCPQSIEISVLSLQSIWNTCTIFSCLISCNLYWLRLKEFSMCCQGGLRAPVLTPFSLTVLYSWWLHYGSFCLRIGNPPPCAIFTLYPLKSRRFRIYESARGVSSFNLASLSFRCQGR